MEYPLSPLNPLNLRYETMRLSFFYIIKIWQPYSEAIMKIRHACLFSYFKMNGSIEYNFLAQIL